ncbi:MULTISPECIES: rod shape-determining protein MreD [unclassified Lonepinella]|uniref:rod shape-determining protein MreD n=1 Tax=unclassified Lonepinella TaxID=2642006 RepID=UPI0036DE810B
MNGRFLIQVISLLCIFVAALVLEIAPWPAGFQSFKPAWLVLVLTYWSLSIPEKISIGSAFVLGVVWDLVLGSVMGVHALVLSVFMYVVAKNHSVLSNLSLLQQSLLTVLLVFCIRIGIFLIEWTMHNATFQWQEIFGAFISGLLWPWVFLLLRKIRLKLQINE